MSTRKSSSFTFFVSTTTTSCPLEILHMDVWGPAPCLSNDGFHFYLIIIDDFSRYCWLFPMNAKSESYEVFVTFKSTIENLLTQKIKIVRTDNGGEFVNSRFCTLFSMHGITHQFTCPYTSEQNGVAKRKHRHVVETDLTLMAHSHMPFTY